jgi:hypothetical protein
MGQTRFASGRQLDLICLGRLGVDLYAQQVGGGLRTWPAFAKYLGGSARPTPPRYGAIGPEIGDADAGSAPITWAVHPRVSWPAKVVDVASEIRLTPSV